MIHATCTDDILINVVKYSLGDVFLLVIAGLSVFVIETLSLPMWACCQRVCTTTDSSADDPLRTWSRQSVPIFFLHESDTGHIPTHSWSHTMTYRCLIALNQATHVTITCLLWPLEAMTMQVNKLYYCAHCDSCDNADYIPVPVVKYSLGNVFFIGYCRALSLGYWGPVTPDVSMLPTSMYCHSSVDMI